MCFKIRPYKIEKREKEDSKKMVFSFSPKKFKGIRLSRMHDCQTFVFGSRRAVLSVLLL